MAQVPEMYSGMFGISPDVNPAYLQLPQTQEAPMPYSPEGWNASRVALPSGLAAPTASSAPEGGAPAAGAKPAGVGFTPEQSLALGKLVGTGAGSGLGGVSTPGFAPKSQVGQMQQLQTGGAGGMPQRQSLGKLLYGRG